MRMRHIASFIFLFIFAVLPPFSRAEARFLQADPIGYEDQMNLYAYVGNDPVNMSDPTGEDTLECTLTGDTLVCTYLPDDDEDTYVVVREEQSDGTIKRTTIPVTGRAEDLDELSDLTKGAVEEAINRRVNDGIKFFIAAVTPAAARRLGNLVDRAGEKAGDVARSRGASGANIREKMGEWADKTLGEVAEAAAAGDESAKTALKVVKEAARLGQKY